MKNNLIKLKETTNEKWVSGKKLGSAIVTNVNVEKGTITLRTVKERKKK